MKTVTTKILNFCINNRDLFTTAKECYIYTIITTNYYTGDMVQKYYIEIINEKMEKLKNEQKSEF